MIDTEKDLPALEFCSLRQALDWIIHGLKPLARYHERLMRDLPNRYGDTATYKHPEFTAMLLTGKFTVFARQGLVAPLPNTTNGDLLFTPRGSRKEIDLSSLPCDRINWDNNVILLKDNQPPWKLSSLWGCPQMPYDAIGEIEIPFQEIKEAFAPGNPTATETHTDEYRLEYEDRNIYLTVNNHRIKLKTLRTSDQAHIFEYIYNHPNTPITRKDITKQLSLSYWNADDRLDQVIIKAVDSPDLRKLFFPTLSVNEVMFSPCHPIPATSDTLTGDCATQMPNSAP